MATLADEMAALRRKRTNGAHPRNVTLAAPPPATRPKLFPFHFGATFKGWHQIADFTKCPKEYQFAKVRGIRQKVPFLSEPLSIGLLVHAARAQWFYDEKNGDVWREAMVEFYRQSEQQGSRLHPDALPIATACFEEYVNHWSIRPTPDVLAIEHELEPRPLVPNAPEWTWRGARLDSVEKWRGKIYVGEMKTTATGQHRVHDIYLLNGQTLLQAALWGPKEVERFGPLEGVLLDILIKPSGRRGPRCAARIALTVAQMAHALSWFRRDFTTWVMQSSLIDWNSTVERRPVCMRSEGPCQFRSVCLKGRAGSNMFVLQDDTPVADWKPKDGQHVPPWE